MAKDNSALSTKLAARGSAPTGLSFQGDMRSWYEANRKKLITFAGDKEKADRMMASVAHLAATNPAVMSCSPQTLGNCLIQAAQMGLQIGPAGEATILPFKRSATLVPMYQGLLKLAYNSGHVRSIAANVVREGDLFEYEDGTRKHLKHVPLMDEDERGDIICAWAVIETQYGTNITVKSKKFIDGIRSRSPSAGASHSPWKSDYESMAVKTVLKQALKLVPKSAQLARAIELDNAHERPDLAVKPFIEIDEAEIIGEAEESDQSVSPAETDSDSGEPSHPPVK